MLNKPRFAKALLITILCLPTLVIAGQTTDSTNSSLRFTESTKHETQVCEIASQTVALTRITDHEDIRLRESLFDQPIIDEFKNLKFYQAYQNIPPQITEFDLENLDRACSLDRSKNYRHTMLNGWHG